MLVLCEGGRYLAHTAEQTEREGEVRLYIYLRVVYDVTNRESFDHLSSWFTELETYTSNKNIIKTIFVKSAFSHDFN